MEAIQLSATARVEELNDRAAFIALEREWDALVERTRNEIFYRHCFIRIWVDNFAPETRLRVLTARDPEGRLVAALPLMEERTRMYGVPLVQLSSTANPHSCRFDLIAEDAKVASEAFLSHLAADPGWDVLRIIDVPEGGVAFSLLDEANRRGFPTGTWASLSSPYIPMEKSYEALAAKLQSKFKANVRRRRKKLEERGKVTVEKVTGGPDLAARLEEGFALEASGWKGQNGTAMAQDKATRGFYSELARDGAYHGYLSLYFLRLDGRAVAFQYGLKFGGRYLLLKPGYDEALKECSPGQLLMDEVLRDLSASGIEEFDFLGPDMVWKRDWTDRVRAHTWMFIFRASAKGRALCKAKFEWLPVAKETVARWKK